jgi:sterol desaturase/sphingolipid hydroxylase (fatty acid hydroxylase superfamily)
MWKFVTIVFVTWLLAVLERQRAFFRVVDESRGSRITNSLLLGVGNAAVWMVLVQAFQPLFTEVFGRYTGGVGWLAAGGDWRTWIGGFLVLDLYIYWWHRGVHTLPLAWRFHAIHHGDRHLSVFTSYRFHPVEVVISQLPKLAIIGGLGIAPPIVFAYELTFATLVACQHSNVALPAEIDRLLRYIIVTPNHHRLHHSDRPIETNSNYGSVFSWWDRLFGSYSDVEDFHQISIGLKDHPANPNLWQLLSFPWQPRSGLL